MAKEILKDEVMSDEELEQVAGGSYYELHELCSVISQSRTLSKYMDSYSDIDNVTKALKEGLGIDFTFRVFPNEKNSYRTADGFFITHDTVISMIFRLDSPSILDDTPTIFDDIIEKGPLKI